MTNELVWVGLMIVFLIAEAACPIHLISIWFAAGSLGAVVVALLGGELWLQITVFVVISLALLASLWPFVKKVLNTHITPTNVDSVVGTTGYVLEEVDNQLPTGRVKLGGMEWTARSETGENIPTGTLVKVVRIEGVKAFVTPANKN